MASCLLSGRGGGDRFAGRAAASSRGPPPSFSTTKHRLPRPTSTALAPETLARGQWRPSTGGALFPNKGQFAPIASAQFPPRILLPPANKQTNKPSDAPTKPMMAKQYNNASSLDYVANGASHPFKLRDFTPRAYYASNTNSERHEEIDAKINRLSQSLPNTDI